MPPVAGNGSQTSAPQSIAQINAQQRAAVLAQSVTLFQQCYGATLVNPAAGSNQINVPPKFVGLTKRFWVKVVAQLVNADANAAVLSDFGLANIFSQITLVDPNNVTRIQTTGWHCNMVAAAKRRWPFGVSLLGGAIVEPSAYGNNFGCLVAPGQINANTTGTVTAYFEVPCSYSDKDLRGAIYTNLLNATMNLGLTLNPNPGSTVNTDSTSAIYKGLVSGANLTWGNVTVTVYQVYLDQLPVGKRSDGSTGVILPTQDISTVYELKNTTYGPLSATNDFPTNYANYRSYLSTTCIYNDNTATDGGRLAGTDLNYIMLQAANSTQFWKVDPTTAALWARELLRMDLPKGMYYFDSREKPISTANYGNMQLTFNPITANAQNVLLVGYEDFALQNALTQAGSQGAA